MRLAPPQTTIMSLSRLFKQGSRRRHCLASSLSHRPLLPFQLDEESRTNNSKTRHRRYFVSSQNFYPHRDRLHQLNEPANIISIRAYHNTSRQEILPLIALGVGIGAIYSYRALQQMDADRDEYYEQLQKYKAATGLDPEASLQEKPTQDAGEERRSDGRTVEK